MLATAQLHSKKRRQELPAPRLAARPLTLYISAGNLPAAVVKLHSGAAGSRPARAPLPPASACPYGAPAAGDGTGGARPVPLQPGAGEAAGASHEPLAAYSGPGPLHAKVVVKDRLGTAGRSGKLPPPSPPPLLLPPRPGLSVLLLLLLLLLPWRPGLRLPELLLLPPLPPLAPAPGAALGADLGDGPATASDAAKAVA
jgi:hypothetical protein